MIAIHMGANLTRERSLLGRALMLSIAGHLAIFLVGMWAEQLGLWQWKLVPVLRPSEALSTRVRELVVEVQPEVQEPPEKRMTFVDVSPKQATDEAPKDATFYSAKNSLAANPDTTVDSNQPKITGTQERVARSFDAQRVVTAPAAPEKSTEILEEPAPVPESQKSEIAEKPVQKAPVKPVDTPVEKVVEKVIEKAIEKVEVQPLPVAAVAPPAEILVAKAVEKPTLPPPVIKDSISPEARKTPRARPRRLAAVLPQETQSAIAGEKMRQAGGVRRFGLESSFDVKSTEFGAYDAAIIAAIQKHWYDLLEDRTVSRSQVGKVVLEFRLTVDGRITNMAEKENEVSSILGLMCQRAVQDPQPYAAWPADLRRLVGRDYREVRFVFHYN